MPASFTERLLSTVEQLTPQNQQRVAEFADTLLAARRNLSSAVWLELVSLFPREDLRAIARAIEERHG